MSMHLNGTDKIMIAGSSVAVIFSLVSIVADFRLGVATIASALVVVLSATFLLLIFRGARARASKPPEQPGTSVAE